MEKQHVGIGEAAKILGVHPNSVRDWIEKGKLKAYRTPGKRRMISVADIKRLVG